MRLTLTVIACACLFTLLLRILSTESPTPSRRSTELWANPLAGNIFAVLLSVFVYTLTCGCLR